jgi:hypothetical protein
MTEVIKIDRDTIIEHLTGSMFDSMENDPEYRWSLCKWGFKGFENMHNDELIAEYRNYVSEDPEYDLVIEMES